MPYKDPEEERLEEPEMEKALGGKVAKDIQEALEILEELSEVLDRQEELLKLLKEKRQVLEIIIREPTS
ncbi:MAG: hypothetical protein NUV70_01870 [Caldiserica bacterium]|jgi:hypothetical protein|nr:hypothetical protein [Caldisericota bacterium]